MNAMRLEKGYRAWGSDFTTERSPAETGVGFLIRTEGRIFTGKDALVARMQADDRWEVVLLEVHSGNIAPFYAHAVHHDGAPVGIVTSAAHGLRTNKTLALAYLRKRGLRQGLSIDLLGQKVAVSVLNPPPFDPSNIRLKS